MSRWKLSAATPRWEAVVATARAYNRPPIEAFIAAGYIRLEEAGDVIISNITAQDLTTDELLGEIRRRLEVTSDDAESGLARLNARRDGVRVERPDKKRQKGR